MVKSATSLTGRGLLDWILQRVSAVVIALYLVFIVAFFLTHQPLTFQIWTQLFHNVAMKITTFVVLFAIMLHAYMGMWAISTDYLTKNTAVRLVFQSVVFLALLGFLVWGATILWGV